MTAPDRSTPPLDADERETHRRRTAVRTCFHHASRAGLETRPDLDLSAYAGELVETFDIATCRDR